MATITEEARIISINNEGIAGLPKYTYAVVTPTISVEFDSYEKAVEWMPLIAVRHVSKEKEVVNRQTHPHFFKR